MDFKKYNEEYSSIEKERKELDSKEYSLSKKFMNELVKLNRKCKFFKTKDLYIHLDSHWKSANKCDKSAYEPNHYHAFNGFRVYTGRKKDVPTILFPVCLDLSNSMEPCGEEEFVREVNRKVKKTLGKYLSEMEEDEPSDYYWKYITLFERYGKYFSKENHETLNKILEKCVD